MLRRAHPWLPALLAVPGMGPRLEQSLYMLSPLTEQELHAVVQRPAKARRVRFETGLVDQKFELSGMLIDRISSHLQILQFAHSLLHRGSGDESGGNIRKELYKISIVLLVRVDPVLFPYSCWSFIRNAGQGEQHLKIIR